MKIVSHKSELKNAENENFFRYLMSLESGNIGTIPLTMTDQHE